MGAPGEHAESSHVPPVTCDASTSPARAAAAIPENSSVSQIPIVSDSDEDTPATPSVKANSQHECAPSLSEVEPTAESCDAETFVIRLLKQACISRDAILALVRLLPREAPHTGKEHELPHPKGAFYAGMCRKGAGVSGLQKSCGQFPWAVTAINKFLRQALPGASYNAFAVLDNVSSPPHRDLQNEDVASHVIAISSFQRGEIWAQDPSGKVARHIGGVRTLGSLLPVGRGPVTLAAASALHSTEPWEGDRVVISC